jgi:hypothetical protein
VSRDVSRYDKYLGWIPDVPGPFLIRRSWLFFWQSVPYCTRCRTKFKNVNDYERHWAFTHAEGGPSES